MAPPGRNFVYAWLLKSGRAPHWAQFAKAFGLSKAETWAALRKLECDHDVVLSRSTSGLLTNQILMSHPFSNLATPHYALLDVKAVSAAATRLENSLIPYCETAVGADIVEAGMEEGQELGQFFGSEERGVALDQGRQGNTRYVQRFGN